MGLFDGNGGSHNHTCPMPSNLKTCMSLHVRWCEECRAHLWQHQQGILLAISPFESSTWFLSGSCAAFVTLVILSLMFLHATHFSRPNEQQKWAMHIYRVRLLTSTQNPQNLLALAAIFLLLIPNDCLSELLLLPGALVWLLSIYGAGKLLPAYV